MDFRVYNRYGELVFISTNPTIGWDGRYKTREERDATFVYVLRYELMDGRSGSLNGNVTLIR
jgi:gliding motility-associated-like protein